MRELIEQDQQTAAKKEPSTALNFYNSITDMGASRQYLAQAGLFLVGKISQNLGNQVPASLKTQIEHLAKTQKALMDRKDTLHAVEEKQMLRDLETVTGGLYDHFHNNPDLSDKKPAAKKLLSAWIYRSKQETFPDINATSPVEGWSPKKPNSNIELLATAADGLGWLETEARDTVGKKILPGVLSSFARARDTALEQLADPTLSEEAAMETVIKIAPSLQRAADMLQGQALKSNVVKDSVAEKNPFAKNDKNNQSVAGYFKKCIYYMDVRLGRDTANTIDLSNERFQAIDRTENNAHFGMRGTGQEMAQQAKRQPKPQKKSVMAKLATAFN